MSKAKAQENAAQNGERPYDVYGLRLTESDSNEQAPLIWLARVNGRNHEHAQVAETYSWFEVVTASASKRLGGKPQTRFVVSGAENIG